MKPSWKFSLPPSGHDERAREEQAYKALSTIGCGSVCTALSYTSLVSELRTGRVDAAWAPPLVCSQLETAGGRVLLRAKRSGAVAYRSVLFARQEGGWSLDKLDGARAGWMDRQSMAGYILPRSLLRSRGLDPDKLLSQQRFLGSYPACVQAVLDGRVDVSASYASASNVAPVRWGFAEAAGPRSTELVALGYSVDCPNDGIVLSPRVHSDEVDEFARAFDRLLRHGGWGSLLAEALEVDGFDVPPRGSYMPLSAGVVF